LAARLRDRVVIDRRPGGDIELCERLRRGDEAEDVHERDDPTAERITLEPADRMFGERDVSVGVTERGEERDAFPLAEAEVVAVVDGDRYLVAGVAQPAGELAGLDAIAGLDARMVGVEKDPHRGSRRSTRHARYRIGRCASTSRRARRASQRG